MSLLTRAESSAYRETSLHADVMQFLAALAGKGDRRLHLSSFGTSPEGRDLPLVVLSAHGVRTPDEARRLGLPVVLVINGIHAGEVEGKEAAMMLMRDLLDGAHGELLAHATLVVVPLFNPDGNDAVDPTNRALDLPHLTGQDGPARVGTRVNASGINLNRDYMRQAAPEMRALQQRVLQVWLPDLTIDTHATNGSVHRMAMTYDVPHTVDSGRGEPIAFMREQVMPAVTAAVEQNHGLLSGWYGNFVEDERVLDSHGTADPSSPVREGWMTYPHNPRFGSNYRGLGGRLDLLLECYSYLTFEERVRTTYAFLLESLRHVAAHGDEVCHVVAAAETPRDRIAVRYQLETFAAPIKIPTRSPRTREGEPSWIEIPYVGRFVGSTVVDRPAGYVVPAAVADHLRLHGLPVTPLDDGAALDVEIATVEGFGGDGGRKILEAAGTGDLEVSWKTERRAAPGGAWLVRTDHRLAAVAAYLCEPRSDDGVVENGVIEAPAQGAEFPIWRLLAPALLIALALAGCGSKSSAEAPCKDRVAALSARLARPRPIAEIRKDSPALDNALGNIEAAGASGRAVAIAGLLQPAFGACPEAVRLFGSLASGDGANKGDLLRNGLPGALEACKCKASPEYGGGLIEAILGEWNQPPER